MVAKNQLDGLSQLRRADWEEWQWIESVYKQFAEADVSVGAEAAVPIPPPVAAESRLQECPDCGKIVSRRATQCPNCGCPIVALGGVKSYETEEIAHSVSIGKMFLLGGLVCVLVLLLIGGAFLGWRLWRSINKAVEIKLPIAPVQSAPFVPAEPPPVEAATPEQIAEWIDEIATETARRLDAGFSQMHLAQTGIAAMQDQAELIDSIVKGDFAKSAKHDKPKRPSPPPYQSRYEPLRKECIEYLKKNVDPKTANHSEVLKQANLWAETKRSPLQKALESQIGLPTQE
jgi:hypothetical protein